MEKIWNKVKQNREIILYIFFGIWTTLINFIVYALCTRAAGLDEMIANVVAWVASVIFAYITNKIFVFEAKDFTVKTILKELVAFTVARLLSLGVDMGIMYVGIKVLFIYDLIVKTFTQIIIIIMNYVLSKFIIFKKEKKNA